MLAKWTPFTESGIARSASQLPVFDELFREAGQMLDGTLNWSKVGTPPSDIYETHDALVLKMDVPGYDPKSFNIQIEGDVLTVQAQRQGPSTDPGNWIRRERASQQVARSFVLPNTVDASKCEATCEQGVLTLSLPKRDEAKPRSITVKVQS